jgi:hypothetical protein
MKIDIKIPLQLKGLLTIQAHSPSGVLLHEEVQENLIVNTGFASLADTLLGDELLNTCIIGRDTEPADVTQAFAQGPGAHGFMNDLTDVECNKGSGGDSYCPVIQDRSIVARSTDDGGTTDVYAYTGDPDYYWSLTRVRIFEYHTDYFRGARDGILANSCVIGDQASDWIADGWGDLATEASFIAEVGFCSSIVEARRPVGECAPDPAFFIPQWSPDSDFSGRLWNRVVLDQSIGFDTGSPWASPDITLPLDAVITVTLELRAYFSPDAVTQVMDINGIETTVRSRAQKVSTFNTYAEGFLRRFGYWRGDSRAGRIGEPNNLPSLTTGYGASIRITSAHTVETGTHYRIRKYRIGSGIGNWEGGIGGIEHGNFRSGLNDASSFCTVFNPKVVKTELERVDINIRYTWSQKT